MMPIIIIIISPFCRIFPVVAVAVIAAITRGADGQVSLYDDIGTTTSSSSPVYPAVGFQVLNMDHVYLWQGSPGEQPGNMSLNRVHKQTFFISGPGRGLPAVNASYGPLTVDAPISSDLLLSDRRILPVILARQVRSSAPVIRILFHMPTESDIAKSQGGMSYGEDNSVKEGEYKAEEGAYCVTAYAFWETREVRGACLVSPGGFCVAQLKPESVWFSSGGPPGRSSKEAGGPEGGRGPPAGNPVEVYFQSRRDQTGQCTPQDSLQRVGRGANPVDSGTPLRRIGSVNLLRSPPGNPTFLRLRLGGAVVVQTSSKPLKATDVATFYVFLSSASTLESFTLRAMVKKGLVFRSARPSDSTLWDISIQPGRPGPNAVSVLCQRKGAVTGKRGLLEVLQMDFSPKAVSEQTESQMITWRLELPGNVKDVGMMKVYTTQRDYVGLAPLVMYSDILNTAVLTGKTVSVPVKTLAVEADGSVTDVTNYTNCRSTEEDILKVSDRCDYVYVNGKETRGRTKVLLNFTYSFLSAQLEVSVWMPRLPLQIHVSDSELSQIKGWRVPVSTGSRRSAWDSEEDDQARKGRGCMLQYQSSLVRVLTPFMAQSSSEMSPDPITGKVLMDYFLGSDWQVDVTNLVRYSLRVVDPDVARLQSGVVLQGRAPGSTALQVLSPLSSSVLAEKSFRVMEDKVSVTELGVQLVSGLSLSLQLSPGSDRAILATATTQEVITQLKQEAVVSCWLQFSDGSVTPLELFDRSVYSLTVSTPDEAVATVRQAPQSTFVVAQGEGEGQGALVRVELRICEECRKSKRNSKLAAGAGLLRMNFQSDAIAGGGGVVRANGGKGSELTAEPMLMVTPQSAPTLPDRRETTFAESTATSTTRPQVVWIGTSPSTAVSSSSTYATSDNPPTTTTGVTTAGNGGAGSDKNAGVLRSYGNMLDKPKAPPKKALPKYKVVPKHLIPKSKVKVRTESDLMRKFRAMSELEIGMYALGGVSCLAMLAFLVNCASYKLCLRSNKTPTQAGPHATGDPNHKHDWAWLGNNNNNGIPPAAADAGPLPVQVSTLRRDGSLESRGSVDSPGTPERTATLGRSRSSSQQYVQTNRVVDAFLNRRCATLLAKPQRNEPLKSPTSKRNQVQFTTFTTLDIKHLNALKKNGVDLNWQQQQQQQQQQQHSQPLNALPDVKIDVASNWQQQQQLHSQPIRAQPDTPVDFNWQQQQQFHSQALRSPHMQRAQPDTPVDFNWQQQQQLHSQALRSPNMQRAVATPYAVSQ